MNKLNSFSISGFRGIKEKMTLNLKGKSILVYGDNGFGKSSITDAFEWFYNDKVEHLISEEIGSVKGKGAFRNLFIPNTEDSFIDIEFSQSEISSKKQINDSLQVSTSNTTDKYKEFINVSLSENLILRYKDLVKFIVSSKKEKLDTLQEIIGFKQVADVRNLLKKNAGRIARTIRAANYDNKKSAQQSIIIENLGQNITSPQQFFDVANELIKPLRLNTQITEYKDIKEVLKAIASKEDTAIISKISFHSRIGENLLEVQGNVDTLNSDYGNYYEQVSELIKEKEKIDKLKILNLLSEGKKLLKDDVVKHDSCPLCQQDKNKVELLSELNERIEELEELKKEQDKITRLEKELSLKLQNNKNLIKSLLPEKLFEEEENKELLEKIEAIKDSFEIVENELKKNYLSEEKLTTVDQIEISKNDISNLSTTSQKLAKDLQESQKKNIKLQIYSKLQLATQAYGMYRKIEKEETVLNNQRITFESLYSDFIKRQEDAINIFLKLFSQNINEYYTSMNPNEKVENIALIPLKDNNDDLAGITIEYDFYSAKKSPPKAYLSESHINCLGLAFYLASVKAFNKRNDFFILDDVISSFDRPHRTRFARLLIKKFGDYQILLLTHEREFYELISSEIKSKGWLLQELHWSKDRGTSLSIPQIDYKAQIEDKFEDNDIKDLGNLIRKYLERQFKIIAFNIEAKVVYRANIVNEKRMAPELLDAVQSKLSKSSKPLKKLADIPKIKGIPMFLGNTTSHDNEFQESIEDLQVMWEDVKKLLQAFYCHDCNKFISIKYFDNVDNKIRCSCGNLKYDWK